MRRFVIFLLLFGLLTTSCMSQNMTPTNPSFSTETNSNQTENSSTEDATPVESQHEHKYVMDITVEPTCTAIGSIQYLCECGDKYEEHVNAIGHNYVATIVKPTYTTTGYTIYTCSVCGDSYQCDEIDVLPHEHNYNTTVVPPTCTEHGYTVYKCLECEHSYVCNEIAALEHNYVTKIINATEVEKGYDLHECLRCGNGYKDNYTEPTVTFIEVNEIVYATTNVNVRTGPSTSYSKVGSLKINESVVRIGIGSNGWSKVIYNDEIRYISSSYLSTTKPTTNTYPLVYSDTTCTITIYREWYKNAWVYAAHLEFTDYTRFGTECANGRYNNGYETTSHAAKRLGALLAINGCYSAPYLNYAVVRHGVVWNNQIAVAPGAYNFATGKLTSSGALGINNMMASEAVAKGLITDTFRFGDACLSNGKVIDNGDTSRAQRTFIGTNGNAGNIWVCVSDGRYNDGESAGLTYRQCAEYLQSKGCIFGIPLDGGGSSTIVWKGQTLNAAKGNERAVVDFVYFK